MRGDGLQIRPAKTRQNSGRARRAIAIAGVSGGSPKLAAGSLGGIESARLFLPLLPEGGEGRGEEANSFKIKSPHPSPLPAWAERGRRTKFFWRVKNRSRRGFLREPARPIRTRQHARRSVGGRGRRAQTCLSSHRTF